VGFYKVSRKTKVLFSVLFPVMLVCWNQGFDVGAFGAVLYRDAITAWIFVLSIFIGLCYIRIFEKIQIPRTVFIILAVPTLWPAIDYIDHYIHNAYIHYFVVFDYVMILFGLIYAVYIFLRLIKADIFEPISVGNKLFIVALAILFSVLGFLAGHHNHLLFECSHFELSGDYVPHNCRRHHIETPTEFRTLYRKVW